MHFRFFFFFFLFYFYFRTFVHFELTTYSLFFLSCVFWITMGICWIPSQLATLDALQDCIQQYSTLLRDGMALSNHLHNQSVLRNQHSP